MAESSKYRYAPPSARRSPPLYSHPGRTSLPLSVGYSSHYGGDIHVFPSSRQEQVTPRTVDDYRGGGPHTTLTTYAVRKDPITRSSGTRSSSRSRRSSTLDSAAPRPIIVTTTTASRGQDGLLAVPGSSTGLVSPVSPPRYRHRGSDAEYYSQPASSIRSHSHQRGPSNAGLDYSERRQRLVGDDRQSAPRSEARRERPTSVYASIPRHNIDSMQYGNEGYEYTKPSDLLRYDLDNDAGGPRQRRESFDRYHRPSVTLTTDYPRAYDSRPRGPPPSTRGFDKIYGLDERAPERRAVPPAAPPPPPLDSSRRSGQLDVPESPRRERRGSVTRARPVSLYQDPEPRASHIQSDYTRSRRDDLPSRADPRSSDRTVFQDDNMAIRGLGIRDVRDADDLRRDRRTEARSDRDPRESRRKVDDELLLASRRDEPREDRLSDRKDERRDDRREERRDERRSDLNVPETKTRSDDRRASRDIRNDYPSEDRVESRRKRDKEKDGDDKDRDHKKPADTVAAVVGAAAAALGLKSVLEPDKKHSDEERRKPKRSQRDDVNGRRPRHSDSEESLSPDERPSHRRRSQRDEAEPRESPERQMPALVEPPPRDVGSLFDRKDPLGKAPAPVVNAAAPTDPASRDSPPAEDGQTTPRIRRRGQSLGFKPTDTDELMSVREQLAALDVQDRDKGKGKAPVHGDDRDLTGPKAPADDKDRISPPLDKEGALAASAAAATSGSPDIGQEDESRGRELAHVPQEEKQVRIVSPGRDKDGKKPIRGILKQPKAAFPEEANPIREGVAPHKDDKTKGNVPPGARWTKINRKLVNPEALTIGKERFEIRDDFVIVLRVLSKEEIDAYATATQQLRERKKEQYEKEHGKGKARDNDRSSSSDDDENDNDDDERRRKRHHHSHRHRREEEDDDRRDKDSTRDRERDRDRDRDQDRDRDRDREKDKDKDRHRHRRHAAEDDDDARRQQGEHHHTHAHH